MQGRRISLGDLEKVEWPKLLNDEVLETCPVCGKAKKLRQEIFISGRQQIKTVPAVCECERQKMDAEKAAARQKEFEATLPQRWAKTNLAITTFRKHTFEADDRGNAKISDICRRYVEKWSDVLEKNCGLLFYGPVGTGKTFLSHAIANALIERGVSVLVTNMSRILNVVQANKDRQQVLDVLDGYQLLVVDDLGAERTTDFARETVYSVIDQRGQARLPLIVTTNLSLAEIKQTEDMQLRRIYDRLLNLCPVPLLIDGESRRTKDSEIRKQFARDLLL